KVIGEAKLRRGRFVLGRGIFVSRVNSLMLQAARIAGRFPAKDGQYRSTSPACHDVGGAIAAALKAQEGAVMRAAIIFAAVLVLGLCGGAWSQSSEAWVFGNRPLRDLAIEPDL